MVDTNYLIILAFNFTMFFSYNWSETRYIVNQIFAKQTSN